MTTIQNPIYEQDFPITELSQPIKKILSESNLPWLNSLEFCTLYEGNRPQRVWLKMDDEKIHHALFYTVIKRMWFFRTIQITGFPDIADSDILRLLKTHHAQLAVLDRLEQPVKPDEEWHSPHAHVFDKSYVTIAEIPPSKEDFLKRLGKNKREQLPKYWRKLNRHFDNAIEVRCDSKTDIKFEEVVALECLNRERQLNKGKGVDSVFEIEQRHKERWGLTQYSGLLVTLRNGGRIIAGQLCYLSSNEAAFNVIAHDAEFDDFRVGTLVIWKTIEYLIDNGITRLNFLWGRQEYKTQFLGVEYPWRVHIISPYQWLAIAWKFQIKFHLFSARALKFLKTRADRLFT